MIRTSFKSHFPPEEMTQGKGRKWIRLLNLIIFIIFAMKKKYLIYAILPVMAFAIIGVVSATSNTFGTGNPMSNLVNAIAEKFNLNVNDVQQVVNQVMGEQKAEMEVQQKQAFTDRINQAVTNGKLTQEQADKILAKKAELETQTESLQKMTQEERQTAMKEQMDSLKQWATDNNIPQQYLMFGGFGRGMGGHGRQDGRGPGFGGPPPDQNTSNDASDSSVQSE